ncbi:MAG: protein kinase [Peptococcaceae bacterium]|jgi:serine/threonine-protein kinase|nr:protein kinase [Peptococcaceae bacterium]
MIQPGTVFNNRFRIEELIGSGGMSLIYRATDLLKHRSVAVKMMREQYAGDPAFIARFQREGQAVARLSHPNIVRIYSVCQDGEIYYLVLELVEGQDLKQLLQSRAKPFPPREIYPLAGQICDALAYAHHQKVIHRDIKPHNIIVQPDGQIKITDFGIARASSEATLTHTGSIMGSVHYLSPEQARGEIADQRSDIYSLGVLLYEMATGKLPYAGESPISVALQKVQQDPLPPRQASPEALVPEALEAVILKAMRRNPRRRYQTTNQLKEDLREACFNNRLPVEDPAVDEWEDTLSGGGAREGERENGGVWGKGNGDAWGKGNGDAWGKGSGDAWGKGGGDAWGGENSGLWGKVNGRERDRENGGGPVKGGKAVSGKAGGGKAGEAGAKGGQAGGKVGRRLIKALLGVLIFVGLAAGGLRLGMYVSGWIYSPAEDVPVPDVEGMPEAEAVSLLTAAGMRAQVLEARINRNDMAAGLVAIQEPEALVPAKPGSAVRLTLSQGPATKPAPSLVGRTRQAAEIELGNAGLSFGEVELINDSIVPEGVVMNQSPAEGTPLLAGQTVDVMISLGPVVRMVQTQSFVGMPLRDANDAADTLGIELGRISYEMSWSYGSDTVIRQTPAPNTEMQAGTPIDLVVSLGPGPGGGTTAPAGQDGGGGTLPPDGVPAAGGGQAADGGLPPDDVPPR